MFQFCVEMCEDTWGELETRIVAAAGIVASTVEEGDEEMKDQYRDQPHH